MLGFQLVQIIFWLALSAWFGAGLFIAIAAPIIFRTVRENKPVLPHVLSVNLEGQHATLLAGSIVEQLLSRFATVELACAAVVLVTSILDFFVADMHGMNLWVGVVRCLICVGGAAIVGYDRYVIWPRIAASKTEYIEHADEPDVANPAKDRFDAEHRRSVALVPIELGLLLFLIVYSANVQPARVVPAPVQAPAANSK